MADTVNLDLWEVFANLMYGYYAITVPTDFRDQCKVSSQILANDTTGLINTVLDYSVNSASETSYKVESTNSDLSEFFNAWLKRVNIRVNGIPTGIKELSKEYFRERWVGSSLCLLRADNWTTFKYKNIELKVPLTLYFVNGASIYIASGKDKIVELGAYTYSLDETGKRRIPKPGEVIVVQKPFERWFTKYPVPYIIRKGIYKNAKAINILQDKGDEVLTKILPYMFAIKKGDKALSIEKGINYSDTDLKALSDSFKAAAESFKKEKKKVPTWTVPFDTAYEHIIPDISKMLSEELYRQGYRALLSALGFVDVVQGIASTRRESILNPAPFVAEINSGVDGFGSMLLEVIYEIESKNKAEHRKYFGDSIDLRVVHSPIKINTEPILDHIRQSFIYGATSYRTYQEALGLDPTTELERAKEEHEKGYREILYPHLVQNQENAPDNVSQPPITKKQIEKDNEKTKIKAELDIEIAESKYLRFRQKEPSEFDNKSFRIIVLDKNRGIKAVIGVPQGKDKTEIQSYLFDKEKWSDDEARKWVKDHDGKVSASLEYILANIEDNLEEAPYKTISELPESVQALPKEAQQVFLETFNKSWTQYNGDENIIFPVAWTVVKKWLKLNGYKKKDSKWVKEK